jgi:hypothetical protein
MRGKFKNSSVWISPVKFHLIATLPNNIRRYRAFCEIVRYQNFSKSHDIEFNKNARCHCQAMASVHPQRCICWAVLPEIFVDCFSRAGPARLRCYPEVQQKTKIPVDGMGSDHNFGRAHKIGFARSDLKREDHSQRPDRSGQTPSK